ncbi:MAG: hypothetical protein RBU37_21945 [Myxococcota bacterium]|nr:hypothetical protein [Myxococcota bacterium]
MRATDGAQQVGGTGEAPNRQELGGTGEAPDRQEILGIVARMRVLRSLALIVSPV